MTTETEIPEEFDSDVLLDSKLYEGVTFMRFFAFVIDGFIAVVLYFACALVLSFARTDYFGSDTFPTVSLFFLVIMAYHAFTLGGDKAATWGMRMTGLTLRLYDGTPLGRIGAVLHVLIFYVAMATIWYICWIVAIFSRHNRPLYDIIGGTYLVRSNRLKL